jgi:hypothetical protein
MIDSVNLFLPQSEINEIDALAEIPNYLTNPKERHTGFGVSVVGNLSNMQVKVKESGVYINGSLPKYLHGHNIITSDYKDVLLAFEKLSDELRIRPEALDKAIVSRVDYAATLAVNSQEIDYFSYLGEKPYFNRFLHDTSLYYNSKAKNKRNQRQKLLFYSKTEELKSANNPNLKDYRKEKLFRYESSILKPRTYFKGTINVGTLKDRQFHRQCIGRWQKDYNGIRKLDALMKDFSMINKPSDVNNYLLAVVARDYGIDAVMKLADDFRRHGRFEKPQYYSKVRNDLAKRLEQIQLSDRHELIKELDTKILEAAAEQLEELKR